MNRTLPAEVQVLELPDGVWYRLPRRPAGLQRRLGLGAIIFGLATCGFAVFWMTAIANFGQGFANAPGPIQGLQRVMLAQGKIPLLVGLACVGVGFILLAGHSEIELRDGKLLATERAGPLHWTWRRPLVGIRGFVVYGPAIQVNGQALASETRSPLMLIRVESEAARVLWLAPGYPREWLQALADDLAHLCTAYQTQDSLTALGQGLAALGQGLQTTPLAVQVTELIEDPTQTEFPDRPNQPVGSKVALEKQGEGLTLLVPPVHLGLAGGMLFTVIVEAFAFAAAITGILVAGVGPGGGLPWIACLLIAAFFWLPGLGMLLFWIHMSRRKHTLVVAGDTLSVTRISPFGSKRRQWSRDQIERIHVSRTRGTQLELQIHPRKGNMYAFLEQRDQAELEWLATILRQALHVPAQRPAARPAGSKVVVNRHEGGVTVLVPPTGFQRGSAGLLAVSLLWLGGMVVWTGFMIWQGDFEMVSILFWIVGLAHLLWAIHMSRRQALLAVVGPSLMILKTGIFGSKQREWSREQIAKICAGPSGTEVNDKPVLELQVHPKEGRKFGLLAGRDESELQWLAALLRQALELDSSR